MDLRLATVRVADVEPGRREHLRALLAGAGGSLEVVERVDGADCDLVVNATPTGMSPQDPLPLDLRASPLPKSAVVADIIMEPSRTAWLEQAAQLGYATHEGRHMLDAQLEPMLEFLDESQE